ncbi:hypothetical protein [Pectobacterium cacticida]|uniref:hypothetical protein n=1 Tax=Pectobacterium cacticida TaxID=69221 RepID=UPI0039868E67
MYFNINVLYFLFYALPSQTVNANQTTPNLVNVANLSTMSILDGSSQQGVMEIDALEKKWASIK